MSEWNGYYVVCFHLFPKRGMTRPFEAQIIGDLGQYWSLRYGGEVVTANKGACSGTPYKDPEHAQARAYRAKVEKNLDCRLERADAVGPVTPDPEQSERVDGKTKAKAKAKPKNKPFDDLLDF